MPSLRILYDRLASLKNYPKERNLVPVINSKMPSIDQVVCMLKGVLPGVEEDKIVQAFYLSKMTVIDETQESGQQEYTLLKWAEFMEFICRLAFFNEQKSDPSGQVPLNTKLQPVLRPLLALVGKEFQEPPEMSHEISESDDEY